MLHLASPRFLHTTSRLASPTTRCRHPVGRQRVLPRRRWRAAAANDDPPPEPQQQFVLDTQPSLLWSDIQLLAMRAESLSSSGNEDEAAAMLGAAVERLEQQHGSGNLALVPLRQLLWDLLYTSSRHVEALHQAVGGYEAVKAQYGAESAEVQLMAVRLGISSAACGQLDEGLRLIYEATPILQYNLAHMLQHARQLARGQPEGGDSSLNGVNISSSGSSEEGDGGEGGEGSIDEARAEELAEVQETIDKVAAALGEGNFYGSMFTLRRAAQQGQQTGVVRGWEELERLVDSGFGSLVAAEAHVDGGEGLVANALREHDSLTQQLSGDAVLAGLIRAQNERLHQVAEQGMAHPLFQ